MIRAGVDIGAKNAKMVIMEDKKILAKNIYDAGLELKSTINELYEKTVNDAGIQDDRISRITATGVAADLVPYATDKMNIVSAIAKAAVFSLPLARTVIEVGAEETRVVRCDENGNIVDFVLNDKCAAGAGLFLESIARALEIKLEEMGPLSLKTQNTVTINTQCVIFAESEVVSLIHRQIAKEEIARSVYDSMSSRIYLMANRLSIVPEVVVVGGVANDSGFVDSMKRKLNVNLFIPELPEFAGCIGACL